MRIVENQTFDIERALYGSRDILIKNCVFDGPQDGESALKESEEVQVDHCFFNLRYPFWHDHRLKIQDSEMTSLCRAALWYSDQIEISNTKIHGIKALRECQEIILKNCDIISPEFGWYVRNMRMEHCTAESEYFMMQSANLNFSDVQLKGKYSFQYIQDSILDHCVFDTKDAFWHAKNVTVKNSMVKGEYLGWYSDGLTLIDCKIIGTQPLCYCKNLKLINCEMIDTDLCFEKSEVAATITNVVASIKNPMSGHIEVPGVKEVIMDDENAKGEIILKTPQNASSKNKICVCA